MIKRLPNLNNQQTASRYKHAVVNWENKGSALQNLSKLCYNLFGLVYSTCVSSVKVIYQFKFFITYKQSLCVVKHKSNKFITYKNLYFHFVLYYYIYLKRRWLVQLSTIRSEFCSDAEYGQLKTHYFGNRYYEKSVQKQSIDDTES